MIEVTGDLWSYHADVRCITTNGDTNSYGEAVMGRGCALQAKKRKPLLTSQLGVMLRDFGNMVHVLSYEDPAIGTLLTFPVKHRWQDPADLALIAKSAVELVELIECLFAWRVLYPDLPPLRIVVPRPGCGAGQRDWTTEVKPLLVDVLDDRFHIIHFTPHF